MLIKILYNKAVMLLIIILLLGGIVYTTARSFLTPHDINFSISSQTVIKEIKALNRLETASFNIEKVIDAGTNGNAFQELLYGDRILLIAHGQVIAGIDMSKLSEKDIQISGKKVTVKLPAPEILVTVLDNNQTRVYDRKQGLLSKGNKDLESKARSVATDTIQTAACKGNILMQASENGKKQLTAFLKALGFETVMVETTLGSC